MYRNTPRPSRAIARSASATWSPQSHRTLPNTSLVRHSLCTRTSVGLSGDTSPITSATCSALSTVLL